MIICQNSTRPQKHTKLEANMRTEKVAFNVPVDILASLKIGARGLESDMRRSLAVQYFKNKRQSLGKSAKLAGMNRIDFKASSFLMPRRLLLFQG